MVNDMNIGPISLGFIIIAWMPMCEFHIANTNRSNQNNEKLSFYFVWLWTKSVRNTFASCSLFAFTFACCVAKCSIFYEIVQPIRSWVQNIFFFHVSKFIHSIAACSLSVNNKERDDALLAIQNYWNDFINMYFLFPLRLLLCLAWLLRSHWQRKINLILRSMVPSTDIHFSA